MTGRDLILYILQNGLENEPMVNNGKLIGYITVEEAAARMDVGTATMNILINKGLIPGAIIFNALVQVPADFQKNI